MGRARDIASLLTTSSVLATDAEVASLGYLTNSSASSIYQSLTGNNNSYRNKLINGDFNIWQRGTSFADPGTSAAAYTSDRWQAYRNNGSSGITTSRQTSGLIGFQYALRLQRNSSNNKANEMFILQMLETVNSIPLAGQTVTLSFYAKAGTNFSAASNVFTANILTGTGTDQSAFSSGENLSGVPNLTGGAIAINQNFNTTTSWARYSVTGTLASNITQVGVRLYYTPSGTAGAADFIEITGIQLELGSVATPYEPISFVDELSQCQRYFIRYTDSQYYAQWTSSGFTRFQISLPVTQRIAGAFSYTGTLQTNIYYEVGGVGTTGTVNGLSDVAASVNIHLMQITFSATPSAGGGRLITSGSNFDFNAEL